MDVNGDNKVDIQDYIHIQSFKRFLKGVYMKNKIFNRLSSLVVIAAMLMGFTVSVSAGNDGLIGANIKDGQLLVYFGDGGDKKFPIPSPLLRERHF